MRIPLADLLFMDYKFYDCLGRMDEMNEIVSGER